MCLGVPGEVIRWIRKEPLLAQAEVRFGDLSRVCHMACVPEARVGDFVVVHAGIAISKIDAVEARRVFDELDRFEIEQELGPTQLSERKGVDP